MNIFCVILCSHDVIQKDYLNIFQLFQNEDHTVRLKSFIADNRKGWRPNQLRQRSCWDSLLPDPVGYRWVWGCFGRNVEIIDDSWNWNQSFHQCGALVEVLHDQHGSIIQVTWQCGGTTPIIWIWICDMTWHVYHVMLLLLLALHTHNQRECLWFATSDGWPFGVETVIRPSTLSQCSFDNVWCTRVVPWSMRMSWVSTGSRVEPCTC